MKLSNKHFHGVISSQLKWIIFAKMVICDLSERLDMSQTLVIQALNWLEFQLLLASLSGRGVQHPTYLPSSKPVVTAAPAE